MVEPGGIELVSAAHSLLTEEIAKTFIVDIAMNIFNELRRGSPQK